MVATLLRKLRRWLQRPRPHGVALPVFPALSLHPSAGAPGAAAVVATSLRALPLPSSAPISLHVAAVDQRAVHAAAAAATAGATLATVHAAAAAAGATSAAVDVAAAAAHIGVALAGCPSLGRGWTTPAPRITGPSAQDHRDAAASLVRQGGSP